MSMPSYMEWILARNVIAEWIFWAIVYTVITLLIGVIALALIAMYDNKNANINRIKNYKRISYVSKRRNYNKRAV